MIASKMETEITNGDLKEAEGEEDDVEEMREGGRGKGREQEPGGVWKRKGSRSREEDVDEDEKDDGGRGGRMGLTRERRTKRMESSGGID